MKKQKEPKFKVTMTCPTCNTSICSEHRHDFKSCKCQSIFVDGGIDYFKFSYKPEMGSILFTKKGTFRKRYFKFEEV